MSSHEEEGREFYIPQDPSLEIPARPEVIDIIDTAIVDVLENTGFEYKTNLVHFYKDDEAKVDLLVRSYETRPDPSSAIESRYAAQIRSVDMTQEAQAVGRPTGDLLAAGIAASDDDIDTAKKKFDYVLTEDGLRPAQRQAGMFALAMAYEATIKGELSVEDTEARRGFVQAVQEELSDITVQDQTAHVQRRRLVPAEDGSYVDVSGLFGTTSPLQPFGTLKVGLYWYDAAKDTHLIHMAMMGKGFTKTGEGDIGGEAKTPAYTETFFGPTHTDFESALQHETTVGAADEVLDLVEEVRLVA